MVDINILDRCPGAQYILASRAKQTTLLKRKNEVYADGSQVKQVPDQVQPTERGDITGKSAIKG